MKLPPLTVQNLSTSLVEELVEKEAINSFISPTTLKKKENKISHRNCPLVDLSCVQWKLSSLFVSMSENTVQLFKPYTIVE